MPPCFTPCISEDLRKRSGSHEHLTLGSSQTRLLRPIRTALSFRSSSRCGYFAKTCTISPAIASSANSHLFRKHVEYRIRQQLSSSLGDLAGCEAIVSDHLNMMKKMDTLNLGALSDIDENTVSQI